MNFDREFPVVKHNLVQLLKPRLVLTEINRGILVGIDINRNTFEEK
jgi:hypothetical protein